MSRRVIESLQGIGAMMSDVSERVAAIEPMPPVDSEPEVDGAPGAQGDDRARCARCRSVVTRGALAVRPGGAHAHTFRNPAGYSWAVRCFADAGGCTSAGPLTPDASWFAGYPWCYAECRACGRHLGWWYVGAGPSFVGLIAPRLL